MAIRPPHARRVPSASSRCEPWSSRILYMNASLPDRRSIRLTDFDYSSPGAYFLTICSHDRRPLFGQIDRGHFMPNSYAAAILRAWHQSPTIRREIILDLFAVMPDHVHGIVFLASPRSAMGGPPAGSATHRPAAFRSPYRDLGSFVRGFKGAAARAINRLRSTPRAPVWQRGYFERVIRNEVELAKFRDYVDTNPERTELEHLIKGR